MNGKVDEIAAKLENGEPISDEEEAERVRRHMEIEENKFCININNFEILKKMIFLLIKNAIFD